MQSGILMRERRAAAGETTTGPTRLAAVGPVTSAVDGAQAVKLVPHPHPPVALGLVNVKPDPCMELT